MTVIILQKHEKQKTSTFSGQIPVHVFVSMHWSRHFKLHGGDGKYFYTPL